jgi:hypothetical protein
MARPPYPHEPAPRGDGQAAAREEPVLAEAIPEPPLPPPISSEQRPPDAKPAKPAVPLPAATGEILAIARTHRLGPAREHQRLVYALLAHTLFQYRSDRIMLFVSYLLIPVTIAVGVLLGFTVAAGLGWMLAWIGMGDVLVWLVAALVLLIGLALRQQISEADISLSRSGGRVEAFKLGRLEEMFQVAGPATIGVFFGVFFGVQHAVLMFTPSHVGLPIDGDLGECFLLTLDNVCHGVFLDTFELYNLHWGKPLVHTFYSATVFYAFRVGFDAMIFLIAYGLWKRFRMTRFFYDFPRDERDVAGVLDWISYRCGDDQHWPRRYHDEVIFLLLSKAFITGDEEFVRGLSGSLRRLQVTREVRELFRAKDGAVLFHGAP